MSIRPVLFIGCGGSGGATLQYVMDNLRTEIARGSRGDSHGIPQNYLPSAWQFVHVDVPVQSDGGTVPGRPPTVPEQGGSYVGLAPEGLSWNQVAENISRTGRSDALEYVTGWLRRPGPQQPPLSQGAGQERSVGRGVTLNSLSKLREQLGRAYSEMRSAKALQELRAVAQVLDAGGPSETPTVVIVSSMAGGAGASMVLDVAQVMARIDATLADQTSMFLYTAEVFEELPPTHRAGVPPNGLAMLGELIATSLGTNEGEGTLLQSLGVPGAPTSRPYRRVFPIGARQMGGRRFGDGSQESIYRAMGRGLAALVSSPVALQNFVGFDLTNENAISTDLEWLGEGSLYADSVQWGTFGYARLSLGRDRYGEYVAQRLARESVDRLVEGHLRIDAPNGEVALQQASVEALRQILAGMNLPAKDSASSAPMLQILSRKGGAEGPERLKRDTWQSMGKAVAAALAKDGRYAQALPGQVFIDTTQRAIRAQEQTLAREARVTAERQVHQWHREFVDDLLRQVDQVVARFGVAAARQAVLNLRDVTATWSTQLRDEAARYQVRGPFAELDHEGRAAGAGLPAVADGHPFRGQVQTFYTKKLAGQVMADYAGLLSDVMADFGYGFADPLASSLLTVSRSLESERMRQPRAHGTAELRTDIYSEWPALDRPVPPRFTGAHNEVVLMGTDEYTPTYAAHEDLIRQSREDADEVLTEIITDRWPEHNDEAESSVVIQQEVRWVPDQLTRHPDYPARIMSRSSARFAIRLSPAEVLERSREWVWRPNGEIGPFLTQGLSEYLDTSEPDFQSRLKRLESAFAATLQQALPPVAVDDTVYGRVHRNQNREEIFKFTAVPFRDSTVVSDGLLSVIEGRPATGSHSVGAFDKALSQQAMVGHIDVFGSFAPFTPLALSSLLRPINDAWAKAKASGATEKFWTNRRARPLTGSIAMSRAEIRASSAGYLVGKITGRFRGSYASVPGQLSQPLQVWSESEGRWLSFPDVLLTPYSRGFDFDELPALLESYLLAIVACGHQTDLSPLRPYIELRHLFARVEQAQREVDRFDSQGRAFATETGATYLERWIQEGYRPDGAPPPSGAATSELGTPEGRKAAALEYLGAAAQNYREVFKVGSPETNPYMHPYDRRPMLAWFVEDLVGAMDEVAAIVQAIETDPVSGAGKFGKVMPL